MIGFDNLNKLLLLFPLFSVFGCTLFDTTDWAPSYTSQEIFTEYNYGSASDNALFEASSDSPVKTVVKEDSFLILNLSAGSYTETVIMDEYKVLYSSFTLPPWSVTTFQYSVTGDITVDIPSDVNPAMEKFEQIRTKWSWVPHNYNSQNKDSGNWRNGISAEQLRAFYTLNYNMAYFLSTQAFLDVMYNTPILLESYSSPQHIVESMLNSEKMFKIGVVRNVSGLGGGSVLGVANHVLETHGDKSKWINKGWSGSDIWFHEFAHCFGFSHNSNMTYGKGPDYPEIPQLIQKKHVSQYLQYDDLLFPPQ